MSYQNVVRFDGWMDKDNGMPCNGSTVICLQKRVFLTATVVVALAVVNAKSALAKTAPAPEMLTDSDTLLWLDASDASSFVRNETGGVLQWKDKSSYSRDAVAYNPTNKNAAIEYGTVGLTNGVTAFLMGQSGSGIDLQYSRMTNIWEVFMVADIEQSSDAFFLGDATSYDFHRGTGKQYAYTRYSAVSNAFCDGFAVTDVGMTVVPTGKHVFCLMLSRASDSNRLTEDRANVNRNGGRAISELIVFDRCLTDYEREATIRYLAEKWDVPFSGGGLVLGDLLSGTNLLIRLDASDASSFITNETGGVTEWLDKSDYQRNAVAYNPTNTSSTTITYGTVGRTNGVTAFLMGPGGSNVDLMYNRMTNICEVFWVMDIERSVKAFFLADSSTYHFQRGMAGEYGKIYSGVSFARSMIWTDDVLIAKPNSEYPPTGTHIFCSWMRDGTNAWSNELSSDRHAKNGRNGGRALSELLCYNRRLTDSERKMIMTYLRIKWAHVGWKGGNGNWEDAYGWIPLQGQAGIWTAGGAARFASEEGTVAVNAAADVGSFFFATNMIVNGTAEVELTGGIIHVADGVAAEIDTPLSAKGCFLKTGAGALTLSGPLSLSGGIAIDDGTVILKDVVLTASGCAAAWLGDLTDAAISGSGITFTVPENATALLGEELPAKWEGVLTKTGLGTLVMTQNQPSFTGRVVVAEGTLSARTSPTAAAKISFGAGAKLEVGLAKDGTLNHLSAPNADIDVNGLCVTLAASPTGKELEVGKWYTVLTAKSISGVKDSRGRMLVDLTGVQAHKKLQVAKVITNDDGTQSLVTKSIVSLTMAIR